MTGHALIVHPHVIVRNGWRGAAVYDRQRIQWQDCDGEIVGYEAGFAQRLIREAARYWFVIGVGAGYGGAFLLIMLTRGLA